jgi:hypothetical protein
MKGTVKLAIRSSRLLGTALWVAHGAAVAVLWAAVLPPALAATGTAALAMSLAWSLRSKAALRGATAIVALELRDDGTVAMGTRDGRWSEASVAGSTFVAAWFAAIHLRPDGARRGRSVLLLPDNVDHEDFRRARVWLRWKSGAAPEVRLPTV